MQDYGPYSSRVYCIFELNQRIGMFELSKCSSHSQPRTLLLVIDGAKIQYARDRMSLDHIPA